MIFKKLELHGFKSFFDRTEVHFKSGVNAVVGPNGCGKSNIADAIRWVLGEQSPKQLRGERMEDLIFAGSESRHPLGMAEVTLTVETTGEEIPAPYSRFTEVCVTRRLYRSGESEFFINNTPCRLRDIRELFLDTGMNPKAYAVIDQGNIGHIISSHPEDRRILIEEAAGIAKFKERKNAALRKLEATEQNLVRVGDVTHEIKRQIGSLQRQARKAERYHELRARLDELDLQVLFHQHHGVGARLRRHRDEARGLEDLRETLRNEAAAEEAGIESTRLQTLEVEKELEALREEFYARRSRGEGLERRLEETRAHLGRLRGTRARGETEVARLATLEAEHAREHARIGEELAQLADALAGQEREREALAARLAEAAAAAGALRERLDRGAARVLEQVREEGERQNRITEIETLRGSVVRELERVRRELELLAAEEAELAAHEAELAGETARARAARDGAAQSLAACTAALGQAREESRVLEGDLSSAREELSTAASRLASLTELERNLSGWPERFQEELDRILQHQDLHGGVRGLLAEGIQTAPEYENALEAVLGERLKCLVVNSPALALEGARVLGEGGATRGTFFPLHPRSWPAAALPAPAPRLRDVVTVAPEYRDLADHLLRDVLLVGDLGEAAGLWESPGSAATYVTREGEVLWPDGAVTAGRLDPARELLPLLRKIRGTEAEAAAAAERVEALQGRCGTLRTSVADLAAEAERLDAEVRRREVEAASLEKDLTLSRQRRQELAARRERLREGEQRAAEEERTLQGRLAEAVAGREERAAERERREAELAALEAELAAGSLEERRLMERISALQAELAAGRERASHLEARRGRLVTEGHRARERQQELEAELEAARADSEVAAAAEAAAAEELGALTHEREQVEARLAEAQERHRAVSGRLREAQERLRQLQARREEIQGELAALQVRLAEEQVRADHLAAAVRERRGGEPEALWDEAAREAVLALPLQEIEERQREAAGQLQALGPVNLAAIGDQQELQQRHEDLRRQQADLEEASRDLHQAIQKINVTSRDKFVETFEAVNEKFQGIFPLLFENGHALLRLTEAEDLLDAGVEVLAQPAGKKLQHISLLSGGEKALTAIALLLAIFMVKPTPFCLMDEVDAPLDETNTKRFLNLLSHSINGSQLVMITHNKRTMESAHHLVGVTMADPGVSRLISVQLREKAPAHAPLPAAGAA